MGFSQVENASRVREAFAFWGDSDFPEISKDRI